MKKLRAKDNPAFDPKNAKALLPGIARAVAVTLESLNVCRDLLGLPELVLTNGTVRPLPSPATGRKISDSVRRKIEADVEAVVTSGIRTKGPKPTRKEVKKAKQKLARKSFTG